MMATTDAQKRATMKYAKEKLKRIPLDVTKEKYDEIKDHCEQMQEKSINGFIKRAIDEAMERDKK